MTRPRLLDLFCGAGGCAMGYHRAGFDVVGVDINPQPRYPFEFHWGDALAYVAEHGHEYDAIHASPPCQGYTTLRHLPVNRTHDYPLLVEQVRNLLQASDLPYVIENVPGAPLQGVVMLCGSSFGLNVRRHRWFETSMVMFGLPCLHHEQTPRFRSLDRRRGGRLASVVGVHGHANYAGEFEIRCAAMGIDWMSPQELTQAIPPAYTAYIGTQLMQYMEVAA